MKLVAFVEKLNTLVGRAAAWLGLLMVLLGAVSAIASAMQSFTDARLSFVALDEAQWYLFSLMFLFAAPWALREDAHVRVDVLYGRLGPRGQAWTNLLGGAFLLVPFCVYAVVVTIPTAAESVRVLEVSPDAGGLVRWPLRLAVPVAFALIALQGVVLVMRSFVTLRSTESPEPQAS